MLMRRRTLLAAVVVALGLTACADITTPPPGRGKLKTPGKSPSADVQTAAAGTSAANPLA